MHKYLNLPHIQSAIGVNLNYTPFNNEIYYAFQQAGDMVYPGPLQDLSALFDKGARVAMYSGDADYICNLMGGEAVSLAVNYTHGR